MAAILMVCMVTFVFCTGMRGDMQDRILALIGQRSGPTVFTLHGRSVGRKDLDDLKVQRNLANDFMKNCADTAFKKISKIIFDENKKLQDGKDQKERTQRLTQLAGLQSTLAVRKARNRYFDGGVKFDDLVEFKLWQAEADRLGVRIEEEHLNFLFAMEFFNPPITGIVTVNEQELAQNQQRAIHNHSQTANAAMVRRAVAEEFRVKIAQLAVLGSQPGSFRRGGEKGEGITLKLEDPGMPDEIRAPLTLAQMWDAYKAQRSEFDVTLVPVHVKDWVAEMAKPDLLQKRKFFNENKDKPNDPSSEFFGLETPAQAKIEFLYADPKSPAYLNVAKLVAQLRRVNPIALDVMQSPLVTAARFMAVAENDLRGEMQKYYDRLGRQGEYHKAAFYSESDCVTPILVWMASRRDPEAIASLVGAAALAPFNPLEYENARAGFVAWGAMGRPAKEEKDRAEARKKHEAEIDLAVHSEVRRRAAKYADLFAASTSRFPFDLFGPFLALEATNETKEPANYAYPALFNPMTGDWQYLRPRQTIETVESEIREMLANRTAEAWAQADMEAVRSKLLEAADAEQFKRALKTQLAKYNTQQSTKLTYGPPAKQKNQYHSRFNVDQAEELEVLKDAYLKSIDMINMFEGRDLTPERLLKPADYWKMFFDGTENFAATATHRAMSWPPEVRPNPIRMWQRKLNPRLVNEANVNADEKDRFFQHLAKTDPTIRSAPDNIDLFKTATKPILFWRTSELPHNRQADYDGIEVQIQKLKAEIAKLEKELQKKPLEKEVQKNPLASTINDELRRKETEVKDLNDMLARVVEGWQLEQARTTGALPEAKKIALRHVGVANTFDAFSQEAKKKDAIKLADISTWQMEQTPHGIDYYDPNLPKGKIDHPRDDTIKQVLSLHNLSAPISIGFKELDAVNKELFDAAKKANLAEGYVQILTDKPRRTFYVAAITRSPKANEDQFRTSMRNAPFTVAMRDHFAERAQEQEVRRFRQDFVTALKNRYKYECPAEEEEKARKDFAGD